LVGEAWRRLVLTALTVAMVVAGGKAFLVARHFMHLDRGEGLNAFALVASFLFLILLVAVTLLEMRTRGDINPETDTFEYRKTRAIQRTMQSPDG
jgi:caa(3)-type oxidase subunit IV